MTQADVQLANSQGRTSLRVGQPNEQKRTKATTAKSETVLILTAFFRVMYASADSVMTPRSYATRRVSVRFCGSACYILVRITCITDDMYHVVRQYHTSSTSCIVVAVANATQSAGGELIYCNILYKYTTLVYYCTRFVIYMTSVMVVGPGNF